LAEAENFQLKGKWCKYWNSYKIYLLPNFKLEKTIQMNEQKMTGKFSRKMELQNSEHQKEKLDLKVCKHCGNFFYSKLKNYSIFRRELPFLRRC
jgi:hypothetical protein